MCVYVFLTVRLSCFAAVSADPLVPDPFSLDFLSFIGILKFHISGFSAFYKP